MAQSPWSWLGRQLLPKGSPGLAAGEAHEIGLRRARQLHEANLRREEEARREGDERRREEELREFLRLSGQRAAERNVARDAAAQAPSASALAVPAAARAKPAGPTGAPVPQAASHIPPGFDVFLCHNSRDRATVKALAHQLKANGLRPWLDEWELPPGQPWQPLLEQHMKDIRSAAVCIGGTGVGPWQALEVQTFLWEFVRRGCPVIPVLLPDAPPGEPTLPLLLRNMTWVDFRRADPDPLGRLMWGIRGHRLEDLAPASGILK